MFLPHITRLLEIWGHQNERLRLRNTVQEKPQFFLPNHSPFFVEDILNKSIARGVQACTSFIKNAFLP